ncbi:DNA-binding response regulator [Paenibacillaceae bacterium]|nr:DNA-binding response regulator [Paenibacillaceae bacterium]
MQQLEDQGSMNDVNRLELNFIEGQYCETTKRIVMISPLPGAVRSLIIALTIRCYDVLVFHHDNDPVLRTIDSDLIIIDRTMQPAFAPQRANVGSSPAVLFLTQEGEAAPDEASDEHTLLWPCPLEQAISKIEAMVQLQNTGPDIQPDVLRFRDVVVDLKRITVRQRGGKVELTKTEFDLLKVLLLNGGGVMTRQQLMTALWGDSYFGGSNSVDVHIKSLRQKLGDDPKSPHYIATVRGVGYRIAD